VRPIDSGVLVAECSLGDLHDGTLEPAEYGEMSGIAVSSGSGATGETGPVRPSIASHVGQASERHAGIELRRTQRLNGQNALPCRELARQCPPENQRVRAYQASRCRHSRYDSPGGTLSGGGVVQDVSGDFESER